jgi:hypothetical protein
LRFRSVAASLLKMWRFRKSIEEPRNNGCACTPDVWRLCGAQVPDVDRIVACLRRNTAQISEPCRAVIEPTANSPRRRDDQPRPYDRDHGLRPYNRTMGQGLTTTNSAPPLPMIATRSVWNGVVVDHLGTGAGISTQERHRGIPARRAVTQKRDVPVQNAIILNVK